MAVIKSLGPGGAERLLVEFARCAPENEIDLHVVSLLDQKRQLIPPIEESGATVCCIGVRGLRQIRWVPALLAAIRRHEPDVVHTHSPALAPVVRIAARIGLLGRPRPLVVTTDHNTWDTYRGATQLANRLTAPLDDVAIAVSNEVRSSISPQRLRGRVQFIRHGVDLGAIRTASAERASIRASLGVEAGEVVVVTVANYRAQKNYPNLLAAAALATTRMENLRFVVVGQGPLASTVEAEHRRLGLGDRMLILGFRPDAHRVMAACDIFSLASDYEGLPVALMEALALGLPVVATSVGGVAETVSPQSGRLVPPRDSRALADALVEVASDGALRAQLSAGALAASEQFDSRVTAAAISSLYRERLARRRPGRADRPTHR